MKLGAEPKRLAILGALLLVAAYFIFTNSTAGPPQAPSNAAPSRLDNAFPAAALPAAGSPVPRAEPRIPAASSAQEFRPSLRLRRPGQAADLSLMDATLRLDLLARLQEVGVRGGGRSLFEFAAPPLPPQPKVIPAAKVQTVPLPPPPPKAAEPPPKPTAPQIPLKFYGHTTAARQAIRRAFFLDGDQILVGGEGEVLKKRYRVVRIGVNSVVMEDVDFKAEQTLPLEPPVG